MRARIGVDLDGTLNDIHTKWLSLYNYDFNDSLTKEDIKSWDVHKWVKPECGTRIYDYFRLDHFFLDDVATQPDAIGSMRYLIEKYHRVYIVTSYSPYACLDKAKWIMKYFPCFAEENIIFCNQKHLLNLDYLIDDSPRFISSFPQQGIVFDAPWNRSLEDEYPRLLSWSNIQEIL